MANFDCLILGGGVIGLSLAYELSCQGMRVGLLERGCLGGEASWAGAGILPPADTTPGAPAHEQLRALANTLHARWHQQLLEETGVDNGYRVCGGLYLDRDTGGSGRLASQADQWRGRGIRVETLTATELVQIESALATVGDPANPRSALHLPEEAQLRNPRHLKALFAACSQRGVTVHEATEAHDFVVRGSRVQAVRTAQAELAADRFCVAGGAWSGMLASRLGCSLEVQPVRGQIALLQDQPGRLRRVINEGRRYLVPRGDGRILVGSTEEDAGFDKRPTAAGIAALLDFAISLAPALAAARIERTWAGLRPGTPDDLPYLGRLPGVENAFVAAGHFRSGLQLSTATAAVLGQLIRGQASAIDLAPFSPQRSGQCNGQSAKSPPRALPAEALHHHGAPAN